jgi:multiple sugar transport system permease protein
MMQLSRERFELAVLRVLRVAGIIFFGVIAIFPFYWMVVLSFRPLESLLRDPGRLYPTWAEVRALEPYRGVLFEQGFGRFVANSALIASVTTVLSLLLAIMGAYAVARLRFRGRNLLSSGILLIYMFPAIVLAIPLFVIFSRLGLRGSLVGLIIVYLAQTLPVALYMLRSYFQTIPYDLEEAGMVDGCTRIEVIWRITLPLALPALASVGLYTFMIPWNEFLFALLFLLESPARWTLSLGVQQLDSVEVPKTWLMAGSVITTLPIIVLFFFFERFLTRGLTAGAVKG